MPVRFNLLHQLNLGVDTSQTQIHHVSIVALTKLTCENKENIDLVTAMT